MGKLRTKPYGCAGRWIIGLIAVFLFPACSGQPVKFVKSYQVTGVYHRVKSGETLYLIARAYNVSVQELAEANNIEDPNRIETDSVVFVPDARQVIDDILASVDRRDPSAGRSPPETGHAMAVRPQEKERVPSQGPVPSTHEIRTEAPFEMSTIRIKRERVLERFQDAGEKAVGVPAASPSARTPEVASIAVQKPDSASESAVSSRPVAAEKSPGVQERPTSPSLPKTETETIQFDRKRFVWPVKGRVVARFGIQPNGMYYNGIMIAAKEDVPVLAAAKGTVIFSGPLKDYGETIILKHEDHYATVYTRLGQRKVKVEDRVKQAEMIGYMGKGEEKAVEPRLNFEIRYQNKARNPMFFLP